MEKKWLRLKNDHLVTLVHVQQDDIMWRIIGGSPLAKRFKGEDVMALQEWIERGFGKVVVQETGGE